MLDTSLIEQLKSAFSPLENEIELVYFENGHADLPELLEMLNDIASTSSHISVVKSDQAAAQANSPEFYLRKNKITTGIIFKGIPNGHEFTSLILAILHADDKGKFPDSQLVQRIKNIRGPVHVKTYISLTCENCPDVVQALNQMALLHDNFTHEMVDGAYVQNEIATLGIQGVPSVVINNTLLHSGRAQLLDLITKLEEAQGKNQTAALSVDQDLGLYDVVIIGGGPAGASAAIYSARKGLKTAIVAEKMGGQVQETKGIENLISVIYTEGPQLVAQLAQHIASYPIKLLEHRRVSRIDIKNGNEIFLEGGEHLKTKNIIIATGAKWRELGIPGEKEYLGRGVAFCPHCDGPFYKGKKIAVIGGGNSGVEAAIDLAGIVKEVVIFEYMDQLKADKVLVDKMNSLPNIRVITSAKAQKVIGDGQKVSALEYQDRTTEKTVEIELDGIFVQIGLLPNSQFIKDIVETTKFGEIIVDTKGRSSVKGIYAAGDVTTTPYKQIIISMGEGAKAALAAFEDQLLA